MLQDLPGEVRQRFQRLHARCRDMRAIAAGVGGIDGERRPVHESIGTPGLDRLLWLFLRLLMSKHALDRFLSTTNEQEITGGLAQLEARFSARRPRVTNASSVRCRTASRWQNSGSTTTRGRRRTRSSSSIELDRIENKIHALAEMTVNRQDPDFLSSQVDSAAESMRQTEKAVSELQHLTGLGEQLDEPPPILDSNLREVLRHDA